MVRSLRFSDHEKLLLCELWRQETNRAPSTVSREVERNGGIVTYRAATTDQTAWDCQASESAQVGTTG